MDPGVTLDARRKVAWVGVEPIGTALPTRRPERSVVAALTKQRRHDTSFVWHCPRRGSRPPAPAAHDPGPPLRDPLRRDRRRPDP